jgi:hypothetical protein
VIDLTTLLRTTATLLLALLAGGCSSVSPSRPGDAFWNALQPLCGKAFAGKLVEGTEPSDAEIGKQSLIMHVRECSASEIRIPFHVGENRSRTWVLTRTADGVRLKHDHRHEDGTEDRVTQYGGDTRPSALSGSLDFYADEFTARLLPASATNIWTMAVDEKTFTYALRREATGRRFIVAFDLTAPIPAPPAPW